MSNCSKSLLPDFNPELRQFRLFPCLLQPNPFPHLPATNPFKVETNKVPDFSKYMSKGSGNTNQLISYFMVGTLGAISAAGAKDTIQGELLFECFVVMGMVAGR